MSVEVIKAVPLDSVAAEPERAAPQVELSVVVPAYREGRRIYNNLTRLIGELDKLGVSYEIVVVSTATLTLRSVRRSEWRHRQ